MNELFRIARFDGDGIVPEIKLEAVKVLKAVESAVGGFRCEFVNLNAGATHYLSHGVSFPDEFRKAAEAQAPDC